MIKISLLLASAVLISACGGGGSATPTTDLNAPVVNAGNDQVVAEHRGTVSLSATATDADGTIDSVEWIQTGGSPNVSITLSNTNNASFDAPQVSGTQLLTFTFSAEDNDGKLSSDTINVTITDNVPVASAGANQWVEPLEAVTLAATVSGGNTAYSYQWTQIAGETVFLLPSATVESPIFLAPITTQLLRFSLVATDSDNDASAADTVAITVDIAVVTASPPVANAGPDQSVSERATVQLDGSGSSDADGTISTYAWQQNSGTAVVLSDASAESPSFTAPDVDGAANQILTFQLTVTDDDSSTNADTVDITVANTHVDVTATFRFERVPLSSRRSAGLNYAARSYNPSRGITVAIGDNCGSSIKTVTDANGSFTTRLPINTNSGLIACSELVSAGDSDWQVSLVDNTSSNAQYGVRQAISVGNSDINFGDVDIPSGWSDANDEYSSPRLSGPFAILDSIYDAIQKTVAEDSNFSFPALTVNWSVNNTSAACSGGRPNGCIGTSFYQASNLFILGRADVDTDEFDTHVVIHEWGHYFEDNLSRSDSIGGAHSGGDRLDMRVAFGEGFGNALSGIVTDDPAYRDSFGSSQSSDFVVNVENNSDSGWYSETTVQSVLYDIYDSTADGDDSLAIGWGPLLSTFISAEYRDLSAMTSIFSFLQQLKITDPSSSAAIDSFVAGRGINSTDAYASGETNDGSLPTGTALPVYTSLPLSTPTEFRTTDNAGTSNKLGNRRFGLLQTTNAGTYTFVTSSSSAFGDTDFVIRLNGTAIAVGTAEGEENRAISLSGNTEYVVEIYDFNNISGTSGEYTSTLTVSPPLLGGLTGI
jgi:hypothetical protein